MTCKREHSAETSSGQFKVAGREPTESVIDYGLSAVMMSAGRSRTTASPGGICPIDGRRRGAAPPGPNEVIVHAGRTRRHHSSSCERPLCHSRLNTQLGFGPCLAQIALLEHDGYTAASINNETTGWRQPRNSPN